MYRSRIIFTLTKNLFLLLFFLAYSYLTSDSIYAQSTPAKLRIVLIASDDGTPVIGATLILHEQNSTEIVKAGSSDSDGFIEFSNIKPGEYDLVISFVGFEKVILTVKLEAGETLVKRIELETDTIEFGEVVIGVKRGAVQREAGLQTISVQDIKLAPGIGGGGDLTLYLQTLPGVVTSGDRGGELFIRGGTPSENLVLVDKMPVIKPFHISNLFSAFPQSIIGSVDMYAGGFGAEYEGATSSVLDINLRQGNMRNYSTQTSVSPYLYSFLAEGPISKDKSSLILLGRRSLIENVGPTLIGQNVPLLFYDMMMRYSANWDGFTCSITGIHTYDRGKINPQRDIQLSWGNTALGGRCLSYSEELKNTLDIAAGYSSYTSSELTQGDIGRTSNIGMGFLRLDNSGRIAGLAMNFGLRWTITQYTARLDKPFSDLPGGNDRYKNLSSSLDKFSSIFGGYVSTTIEPNRFLKIVPGITTQIRQDDIFITLEPRLRTLYRPFATENTEISLALGRYVQMREALTDERDAGTVFYVYKPIDIDRKLLEATHVIAGFKQKISDEMTGNLEAYYKDLKNVPVSEWTREPGNTIRSGLVDGEIIGFDFNYELTIKQLYISLGYGYSLVEYVADPEELVAWIDVPTFRFNPAHDRRHQLNVLASYNFLGFTSNISWKYTSGAPFTKLSAIDLIVQVPYQSPETNQGTAVTLYSVPYDGVLPSFHRLDFSLERVFNFSKRVKLETEIGAINAYDATNVFYFDVNTLKQVNELPLLPYIALSLNIN